MIQKIIFKIKNFYYKVNNIPFFLVKVENNEMIINTNLFKEYARKIIKKLREKF